LNSGRSRTLSTPVDPGSNQAFVRLATVLAGAVPFKEGNVNDTYRGQLLSDDGSMCAAIIKDLDQRQLANELMAAALAKAAGLPVPTPYLAIANQAALAARKGPRQPDGSRLVFASSDVHTPPIAQLYLGGAADAVKRRLADWDGIGGVYGFDAWIANIDRHERNLLFSGDKEVWLIDHGHCFSGPRWKPADLDPKREYPSRLQYWLTPVMSSTRRDAVADSASAIESHISAIEPNYIGQRNRVTELIDQRDFTALAGFLSARCQQVPRLAAATLNIRTVV
jgi:HipA-like kinase